LSLSPAKQDALDQIEASLNSDDDNIRASTKTFRTDLIAGIQAGKLDTLRLTADDDLIAKAMADHESREATSLDALYGLLDATQRATLVASVRSKQAEHESRMAGWLKAKDADGGAPDWSKKRLDRLTSDLALDPDQQRRVAATLAKVADPPSAAAMLSRWDDRKARAEALLDAFASESFDAKKLDLHILPGKTPHESMDHIVTFFARLLPILHADQRDKLATSLDRLFRGGGHPGTPGVPSARGAADDIVFPFMEPADSPARE
jgi:hypothetical protein